MAQEPNADGLAGAPVRPPVEPKREFLERETGEVWEWVRTEGEWDVLRRERCEWSYRHVRSRVLASEFDELEAPAAGAVPPRPQLSENKDEEDTRVDPSDG